MEEILREGRCAWQIDILQIFIGRRFKYPSMKILFVPFLVIVAMMTLSSCSTVNENPTVSGAAYNTEESPADPPDNTSSTPDSDGDNAN
jgi:hypothetical protein